jgi:hypothetical protein
MELGNSFLHLPAHCRGGCQARSARCFALMDGIEKCLKISSCRALNALKGKIVKKGRIWGLMDGLCAFLLAGSSGFSMLLQAIIPVAIMGHTFFLDEESMQRNHGCWQNH